MTKKSFMPILLCVVFFNSNIFAQDALKKGVYSLSGSVAFTNYTNESKYDETKFLDVIVSPSITYFFLDNLAAGLGFSYAYSELKYKDKIHEATHIRRPFSIGALIRYYVPSENIIPFVEAGYRYSNTLNGHEDMNTLSFTVGINYFLSRSVALEPYIEYKKTSFIVVDQETSGIAIGMRISYFIVN